MSERRMRLGIGVLALVLLAAGAAAAWRLHVHPALAARARAQALARDIHAEEAQLSMRAAVAADVAELAAALAASGHRLPAEPRLDDFVAEAGRQARRQRVRIVQMQPGETRPEDGHAVVPVSMVVEGDFRRIYAWMIALETAPRLVRFETLRARAQPGAGVRAELGARLLMGAPQGG